MGHGGKAKVRFLSDQAIKHNAFAVAVTESWLTPDVKDAELTIHSPEFSVFAVSVREDLEGEYVYSSERILVGSALSHWTIMYVVY